ncbi:MAG: prepilin-type N-terminal cleavage/methylation domain-containing protein [Phycisphaerales bacterium]|nr:GspH/FimT family pseudopilin [Phycisphaerae bacterium]NNF43749.1 prepilin-type N-terminal cleavage/methylation domain-containing protein [Phycisphaerales bacterium]NNM26406.1 prepilin-type N-terminal cleavage/methylation domain-containing protein [Phycisphaerales bacterium]
MIWSRTAFIARSDTPRRGYSLVEISIVLILIATVAAIAAPRYARAGDRYRLDAAAHRIVLDLAEARAIARSENRTVRVQFSTTKHRYTVLDVPDPIDAESDYRVELDEPPYRVHLVSASFDAKTEVNFNPYGSAVIHPSGRSFDAGTITIASGGDQRVITIDSFTGEATQP